MQLIRLLYVSRAASDIDLATVRGLNRLAQARNKADNISGLLCFAEPFFVQCLEGPRSAVSRTIQRIYHDPRHTAITLIGCSEVSERAFAEWSMKLVLPNDLPADQFLRVCKRFGGAEFRPDLLSTDDTLRFLREVAPAPERVAG